MNDMRKLMETLEEAYEDDPQSDAAGIEKVMQYLDKNGKPLDGYEVYTREGELIQSISRQPSKQGWWNVVTQSWRGRGDSQTIDSGVAEMQVYKVTRKRVL